MIAIIISSVSTVIATVSALIAWKQYDTNLTLTHLQNLIAERDKLEEIRDKINFLIKKAESKKEKEIDLKKKVREYRKESKLDEFDYKCAALGYYSHYIPDDLKSKFKCALDSVGNMTLNDILYAKPLFFEKYVENLNSIINCFSSQLEHLQKQINKLLTRQSNS